MSAEPVVVASLADAPKVDRLATQAEALRAAIKDYTDRVKRLRENLASVEARLLAELASDTGEVAVAHNSGRIAYTETGFLGAAGVDEEALKRHADTLAGTGLEPREVTVTKLPSVGDIRAAEAKLRALGIDVRELLDEAPSGAVLRWRSAAPRVRS